MKIEPTHENFASHRQFTLTDITAEQIEQRLGFPGDAPDDSAKVVNSWRFTVDGEPCAIWDYYGSHERNEFSAWGNASAICAALNLKKLSP